MPGVTRRLDAARARLAGLAADAPERASALIDVARELLHREPDRASEVANEAALAAVDPAIRFEALAIAALARLSVSDFDGAGAIVTRLSELVVTRGQAARLLTLRAIRSQRSGEVRAALDLVLEALRLLDGSDDARGRGAASAHNVAGNLLSQFGDLPGAIEQFHLALQIFAQDDDDDLTAVVRNNIGRAHRELRQFDAAEQVLRDALARSQPDEPSLVRAVLLGNLASVLIDTERVTEASALLAEALRISRAIGYARGEGGALHSLALARRAQGDLEGARAQIEAARACRAAIGERLDLADTEIQCAGILFELGRVAEAEALL